MLVGDPLGCSRPSGLVTEPFAFKTERGQSSLEAGARMYFSNGTAPDSWGPGEAKTTNRRVESKGRILARTRVRRLYATIYIYMCLHSSELNWLPGGV